MLSGSVSPHGGLKEPPNLDNRDFGPERVNLPAGEAWKGEGRSQHLSVGEVDWNSSQLWESVKCLVNETFVCWASAAFALCAPMSHYVDLIISGLPTGCFYFCWRNLFLFACLWETNKACLLLQVHDWWSPYTCIFCWFSMMLARWTYNMLLGAGPGSRPPHP